jgi:mycoredoxin
VKILSNNEKHNLMTDKIILYGSPTCPMISPVRNTLERANADYEYVDIYLNPDGRKRVLEINNGNASVPTMTFPDGSSLTEPNEAILKAKLESMGYTVRSLTLLDRLQVIFEFPAIFILGILMLAFGIYNGEIAQVAIGVLLIALRLLFVLNRRARKS